MTDMSKTPRGLDKIERYNWKMQDAPGNLVFISKHNIYFDQSYQRDKNQSKILSMARDWSWLAAGVIIVAERNGKFYAVDGMHRVSAAMLRSDINKLPCIVFQTESVRDEAKGFIQSNTLRKAVGSADKHRALVLAGDENALLVQRLIEDAEISTSTGGGCSGIKCYTVMHKLASNKRQALVKAWPLICHVCEDRLFSERIIEALVFLVERSSEDITKGKWKNRILSIGYDGLKSAADSAAAYYARGGARVWTDGILTAVNKGMRKKLEVLDGKA